MSPIRIGLICAAVATIALAPASGMAANAPSAPARQEWNDPADIALVSQTFRNWTDAVIAKDAATVAGFHDEGFRAGLGEHLLTKAGHVEVEMAVGNKEMKLLRITATRRVGDMLIVWSQHFIRADSIPELPDLGLVGDWGNIASAKQGFVQDEISIWRFQGDRIKCLSFAASRVPQK